VQALLHTQSAEKDGAKEELFTENPWKKGHEHTEERHVGKVLLIRIPAVNSYCNLCCLSISNAARRRLSAPPAAALLPWRWPKYNRIY